MPSTLESLILGALAILLIFWMQPGLKAALAKSKQAPSDWSSVILPIGLVVMFVLFLIAMV
jgi:TRAP-type C4-dicarboxylate transport system permease small subunit